MNFTPEIVAWRPEYTGPDGVFHSNYSSGSGFSDYFPRPAYQAAAVSSYIAGLEGKYDGLYNKQGRGYPDLSAQGLYFAIFWNGTLGQLSGTSASTPLLAGILFAFGHHAATDPMYPWIAQTLEKPHPDRGAKLRQRFRAYAKHMIPVLQGAA